MVITLNNLREYHETTEGVIWVHVIDQFMERLVLDMLIKADIDQFDGGRFHEEEHDEVKEWDLIVGLGGEDIWLDIDYTASATIIYETHTQPELGITKGEMSDWVNLEIEITKCKLFIADCEFDMMQSKNIKEYLIYHIR